MRIFDLDSWQEIWVAISRNKLRSVLTGLGVFGGIFILVVLLGIGNGFQGGIHESFEGFASNSCTFWTDRTSEAYKGYRKGRAWNMNNRDMQLLRERAQTIDKISPMTWEYGNDKNVVNGQKSGSYTVMGVYPEHFEIQQQHILNGRLFNNMDINGYRKICVIGKEVYETLFRKGETPIGQYIRVNGIYFQVVGVISPKSQISIGSDVESTVFIPFTTMQRAFNKGDFVNFLMCTTKAGYNAADVEEEVKTIIKRAHDISPTDAKALGSFDIERQFQMFDFLFIGVGFIIWFVGIGSLLSGIIGISNIMLITVRERTREIGVKRAIGAKHGTIMTQVICEALVMTAISGLIGFMLGIAFLQTIDTLELNEGFALKAILHPY